MTSRHLVSTLLVIACALAAPASFAGDVYVIANAALDLNANDVRDVFTGGKQFAGPTKLVPVDNASVQADFLAKVLKLDTARYGTLWTKKSFRDGLNPPPVKASDAEVINAVKNNSGGIGYVSAAPPDVKVIQKF